MSNVTLSEIADLEFRLKAAMFQIEACDEQIERQANTIRAQAEALKIATEALERVSVMVPYSLSTLSEVQSVAAQALARIKEV